MVDAKRIFVFVLMGMFLFSMMGAVVAPTGVEVGDDRKTGEQIGQELGDVAKSAVSGFEAFFNTAFNDVAFGDDEWLSKLFFAVLLGMVIYTVVSSFFSGSNVYVQWGISIAVTAIAFVGIPGGYLEALRFSYGAMGLTILALIPFLIMVLFTIKVESMIAARVIWIFYTFYYFALLIGRWLEISALNELAAKSATDSLEAVSTGPYWIAFFVGIVMFFTIPYLRGWYHKSKTEALVEIVKNKVGFNKAIQEGAQESHKATVEATTGRPIQGL